MRAVVRHSLIATFRWNIGELAYSPSGEGQRRLTRHGVRERLPARPQT